MPPMLCDRMASSREPSKEGLQDRAAFDKPLWRPLCGCPHFAKRYTTQEFSPVGIHKRHCTQLGIYVNRHARRVSVSTRLGLCLHSCWLGNRMEATSDVTGACNAAHRLALCLWAAPIGFRVAPPRPGATPLPPRWCVDARWHCPRDRKCCTMQA